MTQRAANLVAAESLTGENEFQRNSCGLDRQLQQAAAAERLPEADSRCCSCCHRQRNRQREQQQHLKQPLVVELESNNHHNSRTELQSDLSSSANKSQLLVEVANKSVRKSIYLSIIRASNVEISCYLLLVASVFLSLLSLNSNGGQQVAAFITGQLNDPKLEFLDAECKVRHRDEYARVALAEQSSKVERMLLFLSCDIKPLYSIFKRLPSNSAPNSRLKTSEPVWQELELLNQRVDSFVENSFVVLKMRDFCSYAVFNRLLELRTLAGESRLLATMFNMIAIELHKSCLHVTISRLPSVPYVVREIVNIYIRGAEKPAIPDLNELSSMDDYGSEFDVDKAIEHNGKLNDVAELLLTIPSGLNNGSVADKFRATCKSFFIDIDQSWQPMELMNKMIATDGNGIKRFNNYIMRKLVPTKYADICTQLSTKG